MQEHTIQSDEFLSAEPISVRRSGDNNTAYHNHAFLEFAYVLSGSAVQMFQNRPVRVGAGDFFMINYGEMHKYSPDGTNPFSVLNVLFKPEFLAPSLKDCRGFQDLVAFSGIGCNYFNLLSSPTSVIFHDEDGAVRDLVLRMEREYLAGLPKWEELLRACLTELLILTLRKIYKRSDALDCEDPDSLPDSGLPRAALCRAGDACLAGGTDGLHARLSFHALCAEDGHFLQPLPPKSPHRAGLPAARLLRGQHRRNRPPLRLQRPEVFPRALPLPPPHDPLRIPREVAEVKGGE